MAKKNKLDTRTKGIIDYFTKTDTLKYVGGGILIAGLLSLWIGIGIIGFILAIVGIPTGMVIYFIGARHNVTDSDVDKIIETKMEDLFINVDNIQIYKPKLLPHQSDIVLEGYLFGDDVMIKKRKTGEICTSEFSRTKLRILSDRLYIVNRKISILEDDKVENNLYEPTYDQIISVEVFREEKRVIFNGNTFIIKPCQLIITTAEQTICIQCPNAVNIDDLAVTITRQKEKYLSSRE